MCNSSEALRKPSHASVLAATMAPNNKGPSVPQAPYCRPFVPSAQGAVWSLESHFPLVELTLSKPLSKCHTPRGPLLVPIHLSDQVPGGNGTHTSYLSKEGLR